MARKKYLFQCKLEGDIESLALVWADGPAAAINLFLDQFRDHSTPDEVECEEVTFNADGVAWVSL